MRNERWWWLGGFLLLSIIFHIFLALHGPGFGLKGGAPSPKEIELTLEPLPPAQKPKAPRPKIAVRPKPQPKVVKEPQQIAKLPEKQPVRAKVTPKPVPKVVVRPVEEKPVARAVPKAMPKLHMAQATPTLKPATVTPTHVVTPEKMPEQTEPVKTASVTSHLSRSHMPLPMVNPLAALATPEDKPELASSAHADRPRMTRSASARTGLAGGASGGGHSAARGAQTPTDQPSDSGLAGGMHFPKMASRIGAESIMSVKNPLAEDAVPEDKPGFSQGAGGSPGLAQGRGRSGLNGRLLASLRSGHGPGLGGGLGGGKGAGSGKGSGRGHGAGRGTGAGTSGNGDGDGLDLPTAVGDGYGRMTVGYGSVAGGGHSSGTGRRVASGGGAFGDVGGLLRGEPARVAGDGRAGTNGHGLKAEIYEGKPYLTKLVHHRTDAVIDFNWGMTDAVVKGVSRIYSVRWTGKIQPQYSETYTFDSLEDDGLKLWVDGQLLINDWKDHKRTAKRGSIHLNAGRKYAIRIEYFNGYDHARDSLGHAEVHLRWSSPSRSLEIVPESAFYQAE